jgi:hypothetical protein
MPRCARPRRYVARPRSGTASHRAGRSPERAGPLRRPGSTQPVDVRAAGSGARRPEARRPPWCTDGHPPRTGQPVDGLPADLAEQELGFSRIQLDKLRQGAGTVAPPQPIPTHWPSIAWPPCWTALTGRAGDRRGREPGHAARHRRRAWCSRRRRRPRRQCNDHRDDRGMIETRHGEGGRPVREDRSGLD